MIELQRSAEPFFTNDPMGFVKVIGTFMVAMSPVFGLTIWFLKRGPDAEIARFRTDLNELGAKVDRMGKDRERDRETLIAVQREMADSHREILDALRTSAQAIQEGVHNVDLKVARLEERSDLSESLTKCFTDLGTKFERVILEGRGEGRRPNR